MLIKGHTFIRTDEGCMEYEKYYDFSELFEGKVKNQCEDIPGINYQEVKVIVPEGELEGN